MAGSLLVPMSVTAKVVTATQPVPSLSGAPFNRDAALETGIHVHWALPDALTRAVMLPDDPKNRAVFPGIPDLWLIVRLNPVPAQVTPKFKRSWVAFVVDSRSQTVTPLAQWQPPVIDPGAPIHTVAGLLPQAASVDRPGWGLWDGSEPFDVASAAYYPTARKRFGFFDSLAGLQKQGKVSYIVAGWYSSLEHDPLYKSDDREKLLARWKLAKDTEAQDFNELLTGVQTGPIVTQAWKPASLKMSASPAPAPAKVRQISRATVRGGSRRVRMQRVNKLGASLQASPAVIREFMDVIGQMRGPSEIICHGSVVDVPLIGAPAPAPLKNEQVKLYPSITRAMAILAAADQAGKNVDFVEMMLGDADQYKGTTAGILDLPGQAHAKNFQGVPGKAKLFARIDVYPRRRLALDIAKNFDIQVATNPSGRVESGHWPIIAKRSSRIVDSAELSAKAPPASIQDVATKPNGPTEQEKEDWARTAKTKFDQLVAESKAASKPINERLIRVQDHRKQAQPLSMGHSANKTGSNQAGFWLDANDPQALKEFFASVQGARLQMPNMNNLYEQPGPRWYRPWSPQVVLVGLPNDARPIRSFRFGEDGRFRADGFVDCRQSGETLSGMRLGNAQKVSGRDALADTSSLKSRPGVPAEIRALVEETALLASDSGAALASHTAGNAGQYENAVRGLWVTRDLSVANKILNSVRITGSLPSPIAITPWKDPQDALFIDTNYAHPQLPLEEKWQLEPDNVELTLRPNSTPTAVKIFDERARVTSSVLKVLDSKLVTKLTLDAYGNPHIANKSPDGVDSDTFVKVDVVSAPLTRCDQNIFDAALRQRSGSLRLNKVDLVDVFGFVRSWSAGGDPASAGGSEQIGWWTQLPPRLPYWSRVLYRLQAASDINKEADPFDPAICGFLLPDFVEHSIEVFDGAGKAIGQLTTDRARIADGQAQTLSVKFEAHPWIGHSGNALDAIKNDVVKSLVAGLVSQSASIGQGQVGAWVETGLTALLRVVDTVRGTLDPTVKVHDRRVRLLGEPIVVLATRLTIEGTSATKPAALTEAPPPLLAASPPLPTVRVRIGAATRPDDGVLGCFLSAPNPAQSKFAPVSKEAAEKAIINGLISGTGVGSSEPVTHPFIQGLSSEFDVPMNQPKDIVVLMDTRGGVYVTCGVAPRKKITLPREQLGAALREIEATFATGPILVMPVKEAWKPALSPVAIEGYDTEFLRRKQEGDFVKSQLSPTPPMAELPLGRAMLTSGWLRMLKREEKG